MNSPGQHELEHRLRIVEDKLAIHELIASHRPGADTGAEEVEIMLDDDEALEGVEAWLNQQEPRINMGPRGPELDADVFVESPAGWLLRLVRHARAALDAPGPGGKC